MTVKVDTVIKPWSDKIFALNRRKYSKLIKWIIAAQRTYKPEQIATALQQFYPYALTENNWWGYLDTLLNKIEGKESGRESEAEHEDRKSKEADFARATFGGRGLSKEARQGRGKP